MTGVAIGPRPGPCPPVSGGVRRRRAGATRRSRRLAATALALALSAALVAAGAVGAASDGASAQADAAVGPSGDAPAASVVVESGETAWEALAPHRPSGMDHAVFVHEVMAFNEVDARHLRPGDVLRVPQNATR